MVRLMIADGCLPVKLTLAVQRPHKNRLRRVPRVLAHGTSAVRYPRVLCR
jgi:hypothetical protein